MSSSSESHGTHDLNATVISAGDLVERLMARTKTVETGSDHRGGWFTEEVPDPDCAEAASRIEELEAALKPFAEAAFAYDPEEEDDQSAAWQSVFDIGDLRSARSSLNQDGGKP